MTDPQEPFNPDYYQHMLLSLTLNSKALIVELTAMAETYVDDAPQIVDLIEDRITKILPKYKLYSFYLLDSVIKNIGSPYNLLFAKNLYKLFTESYLIVEDTNTRQDLINLFQTWMTGQSSSGLETFPREVLQKIESFIIKATSLAGGSAQGTAKISRDTILREGNFLLQQIIAMDDEIEWFEQKSSDSADTIQEWRRLRNTLVFTINSISEDAMGKTKDAFDRLKQSYSDELRRIKQELDRQGVLQQQLFKGTLTSASDTQSEFYPVLNNSYKEVNVVMILDPNNQDFLMAVENWGSAKESELPKTHALTTSKETPKTGDVTVDSNAEKKEVSLAQSLGLSFDSMGFPDFSEDKPRHGSFDECVDEESEKGYVPENAPNGFEHERDFVPKEPLRDFVIPKSSLKRPNSEDSRVAKKVRFDS